MTNHDIKLPQKLNEWTRKGDVQKITPETIFDYMNGSGELYLSYHFRQLSVHEYRNESQNEILAEIYTMRESDDAFGLLSMDWSGEPVHFSPGSRSADTPGKWTFPRALYGKGYLRIWSGNIYVRILAVRDTPAAKGAIMELGRIITGGRSGSFPPDLVRSVPPDIKNTWRPDYQKLTYFHSHLVLNAVYYLSHENILNLGLDTEGICIRYHRDGGADPDHRFYLLLIHYPGKDAARLALEGFLAGYLKDEFKNRDMGSIKDIECFKIEDGWMGYRIKNHDLALVFQCPDEVSSGDILGALW